MASIEESLNNAISALGRASAGSFQQRPQSPVLQQLERRWGAFWRDSARAALPESALLSTLQSFHALYTRAWLEARPLVRAKAPRPDAIDVTLSRALQDGWESWKEGAQDAKKAAGVITGDLVLLAVLGLVGYWLYRSGHLDG